jgi:hypothetical protein
MVELAKLGIPVARELMLVSVSTQGWWCLHSPCYDTFVLAYHSRFYSYRLQVTLEPSEGHLTPDTWSEPGNKCLQISCRPC